MSILSIITVNEYKTRYPDTALNNIRDARVQSALNLSFSYLDVKCGCAISSRWNIVSPTAGYLTEEQKDYVKEAMYVETQYILANNLDFSQGADQTSFGSLSTSSSRPERKEICESALMYLQKAGLYDYLSFSTPTYAGSGRFSTTQCGTVDPTDVYITETTADLRYVHKAQGVDQAGKFLWIDSNGNVALTNAGLDPNNYYDKNYINSVLQPLQATCTKLGLGYLKSIRRNTITKTITITDDVGNDVTFTYGGTGGGTGGGIADVLVNGVSTVVDNIAYISLVNYATKLELQALLNDTTTSSTKTWSSDKIQAVFNTLSGVATIEVVDTLPTTLVNNTMYYVKITTGNYAIKLRVNDTTYDMGTTQIDLSNYQTKLDATQLAAVNSGITSAKVTTYDGYDTQIQAKQDKITTSVKVQDTDDNNHLEMTYNGGLERKVTSGAITETYSATLPQKNGTIALTSDITSVSVSSTGTATDTVQYITVNGVEKKLAGGTQVQSDWAETDNTKADYIKNKPNVDNFVTLNTQQTVEGRKFFKKEVTVNYGNAGQYIWGVLYPSYLEFNNNGSYVRYYNNKKIELWEGANTYTLTIPTKTGTLATLDDIGGGGTWGSITGTLSDQTDLQNALDAKANTTALDTKIAKTSTIETVWSGTLAQYNAITTKDSKTLYNITDDNALFSLQAFYDGLYPVNNIQFGLQAPNVPNGITATWTDVSSEYEGRYFKVSSTDTLGTSQAEQLPNIWGQIGCLRNTSLKEGAFSASFGTTDWQVCGDGGWPAGQYGYNVGVFNAHNSNATYVDGGKVRPLTTTIKVWKRTA